MDFKDYFKISSRALSANKSRAVLTMLGIIIGTGSVTLMTSLGGGVSQLVLSTVSSIGSNSIFIVPGPGDSIGPPDLTDTKSLKLGDAEAIGRLSSVEAVVPFLALSGRVSSPSDDMNSFIVATWPTTQQLLNVYPESGRFFTMEEVRSNARVAVIGPTVAKNLYPDQNPIGQTIKIKQKAFQVIGVLEELGTKFFQNFDERTYIPVTTGQAYLAGVSHINEIGVLAKDDVASAIADIRLLMRDRHNIDNPTDDLSKDNFRVSSQQQAADLFGTVSLALTVFLSAIAAISLVVGGIGIMNIMLVSVTERTMEIGLRKALGATNNQILWQFLTEAMLLTLTGGLIGLAGGAFISWLASFVISNFLDGWAFVVPLNSALLALGVAIGVGFVFGVYPARRAASLNPIEALRYE